ncbi:ADK [Cordylochernes scorpioides]|uniref:Adenosine kinase n=1 Tax=Cordylochernes scorpioides TaxID=51811 RepID=A0ABY6LKZ3_9ARAC|nr:ADK [Cordylochernes scorpioides]
MCLFQGFFLTVSVESVHVVGRHLAQHPDKLFSMNLSAPFICQFFLTQLMEVLPYVDLLFGNDTEALTLSKELKMETEVISEIALKLAEQPKKNSTRPRRVIITQGHLSIVMAYEGKVTEYPVTLIEKSKVVDTNGAGDAFVGGYLSQLIQGRSIEECIKCAVHVASTVVQQSGCTFPAVCTYGDS